MYKVVGLPRTRTMRVMWLLEELGQSYEIVPQAPHTDPVNQGNPGGKIPTLHDGDTVISDSVAICTYLADKHGACTHPAGTAARGHQDAMTMFAIEMVDGPLWTASKNTFAAPEEHRAPEILPVCRYEWDKGMKTLAAHIDGAEFIAGDMFTIPDLIIGHCAGWAERIEFPIPSGPVADYMTRMRARPAFAAAMKAGVNAHPPE